MLNTSIANAQSIAVQKKIKNVFLDSSEVMNLLKSTNENELTASSNEEEEGNTTQLYVPSVLNASRDLFANTAAFHFGVRRFKPKGFSPSFTQVFLNGLPMNQLTDGIAPWSSWSGLNEVMNNTISVIGLKENNLSFGAFGTASYIDLKAAHLRPQTTLTSAFSNRNYQYKLAFTKVLPLNKNGWALAFQFSYRYGNNSVMPGSYYAAPAYFFAIDKKINEHLLSLSLMGSFVTNSRASAVTQFVHQLAQSDNYNPNWGIQQQQKRNANMQTLHYPLLMLSHEYTINDEIKIATTFGYSMGQKIITGIDWYKAPDPRPDYYRYLPTFQTDSVLQATIHQLYVDQPELLQINWNRFYQVNQNSFEVINEANGIAANSMSGKRSKYIVEDRVEQHNKIMFASSLNQQITERCTFSANVQYQRQSVRYFKRVNDLLGGDFYVNWNQFADDQTIGTDALQNDVNVPNRILFVGDAFGYDYSMILQKLTGSSQLNFQTNRVDYFAGIEVSTASNYRIGNVRNGLFPLNSFGKSSTDRFNSVALKAGATYKYNGRNYIYMNAGWMNKPPFINNYYLSPRTRDARHPNSTNEKVVSVDVGYILNAPLVRFRLNSYAAIFSNGISLMSFYHDGYQSLVNYAIGDINQLHIGTEIATEIQLNARWRLNSAIALGKYVYTSRQTYNITIDNQDYISEQGVVYTKNFPVPGTPQRAYHVGFTYQTPTNLLFSITGNYLTDYWVSFNPIRRTYDAMSNVPTDINIGTITNPEKLPDVFVTDLSAAYSMGIGKTKSGTYKSLQFFLSVGNLFNQSFKTGGYEQLRYDVANGNLDKFPTKYYYSQGLNYSLTIRFRL